MRVIQEIPSVGCPGCAALGYRCAKCAQRVARNAAWRTPEARAKTDAERAAEKAAFEADHAEEITAVRAALVSMEIGGALDLGDAQFVRLSADEWDAPEGRNIIRRMEDGLAEITVQSRYPWSAVPK